MTEAEGEKMRRQKQRDWDFPGGPVVKTPRFQRRACRFDPWSGKLDPTGYRAQQKKKKEKAESFDDVPLLALSCWKRAWVKE